MKYFAFIISVLILLFSCKEKEELFEPYCKLSEAEMINVMVDFSLVKSVKSLARKDLKDSGIKPYEYLFIKHGVDSIVIKENLKYYNLDLEKSKKLYDTVSKIITQRAEKVQVILDSIKKPEEKEKEENEERENEVKKDTIEKASSKYLKKRRKKFNAQED